MGRNNKHISTYLHVHIIVHLWVYEYITVHMHYLHTHYVTVFTFILDNTDIRVNYLLTTVIWLFFLWTQAGAKIAEECAAQKKMVDSVFISGAGDLTQNGVKWIVHIRAPDDEADCEKVRNCKKRRKINCTVLICLLNWFDTFTNTQTNKKELISNYGEWSCNYSHSITL